MVACWQLLSSYPRRGCQCRTRTILASRWILACRAVVIATRLRELSWPSLPRKLALLGFAVLSVPVGLVLATVAAIFGVQDATGTTLGMSALANVLLLVLVTGPLLLFGVLLHVGRICTSRPRPDPRIAVA